jgi:hypothetical protein
MTIPPTFDSFFLPLSSDIDKAQFSQWAVAFEVACNTVVGREVLTANRTYYVSTTGSDTTNNGLSTGSLFATLQKAWNVATTLDLARFSVTIQMVSWTR